MKYFILPPNYSLRIDIRFWKFNKVIIFYLLILLFLRIDDWSTTQNFHILADGWIHSRYFITNSRSNLRGDSGTGLRYNDHHFHTLNSAVANSYADCDSTVFIEIIKS